MKKFLITATILLQTMLLSAQIPSAKYALINNVGEELTPFVYDMITSIGNGYFKIGLEFAKKSNDNDLGYGIVDAQGKVILQPLEGQDIISLDVDRNYMIVSKMQADSGYRNLAIFDLDGNEIIPFSKYAVLFPDYNGNIIAGKKLDNPYPHIKYGIIDIKGNVLRPFIYDDIQPIKTDAVLFVVTEVTEPESSSNRVYEPVYDKDRSFKTYVVNMVGDSILSCGNYAMIDSFDRYLHLCDRQSYEHKRYVTSLPVPVLSSYAIMDITNGEIIMEYEDYNALKFQNGLAKRIIDHKVGIVDVYRNEIIPYIYRSIDDFINDLAKATRGEGKIGIINNKGQEVIPCIYDAIEYNGNSIRLNKKNKWGVANISGKIIIPIKYDVVLDIGNRYVAVDKEKKSYLLDKDGQIIKDLSFSVVRYLTSELLLVSDYKSGLNVGAIDYADALRIPFRYTRILAISTIGGFVSDRYLAVETNKKWGIVDTNGTIIIPCEYNSISEVNSNVFIVSKNEMEKKTLNW